MDFFKGNMHVYSVVNKSTREYTTQYSRLENYIIYWKTYKLAFIEILRNGNWSLFVDSPITASGIHCTYPVTAVKDSQQSSTVYLNTDSVPMTNRLSSR